MEGGDGGPVGYIEGLFVTPARRRQVSPESSGASSTAGARACDGVNPPAKTASLIAWKGQKMTDLVVPSLAPFGEAHAQAQLARDDDVVLLRYALSSRFRMD